MKSLATLIKLQKSKVDEQRILLTKLQKQLVDIENQIQTLMDEQLQQRELLVKEPTMAMTYDSYLKECLKRMEALEKRKKTVIYAVGIARDKLGELFEEQKRYELAEQNRIEEEEAEEQRRETHTLDEVGSVGFIRSKKRK